MVEAQPQQAAEGQAEELQVEVGRRLEGRGGGEVALIIYTSGTTGRPKGACLPPPWNPRQCPTSLSPFRPSLLVATLGHSRNVPHERRAMCLLTEPARHARRRAAHPRQPGGAGGHAVRGVGLGARRPHPALPAAAPRARHCQRAAVPAEHGWEPRRQQWLVPAVMHELADRHRGRKQGVRFTGAQPRACQGGLHRSCLHSSAATAQRHLTGLVAGACAEMLPKFSPREVWQHLQVRGAAARQAN